MIRISHKGNFVKTTDFFKRALNQNRDIRAILDHYGQLGLEALRTYTPKDTGLTASLWTYEIIQEKNGPAIVWSNSNINKGVNIALIIQRGHGTRNGGYVKGIDYINPALKPIFDELADEAFREVTK